MWIRGLAISEIISTYLIKLEEKGQNMKKRKIIICAVALCIVVLVGVFVGVSSYRDYTKALDIPQKSEISIKQYSTGKEIQLENDDADKMAEMLEEHLSYKGITYDDSVVSSEEDVYSIMISSTDFLKVYYVDKTNKKSKIDGDISAFGADVKVKSDGELVEYLHGLFEK